MNKDVEIRIEVVWIVEGSIENFNKKVGDFRNISPFDRRGSVFVGG